jgi:hypothetical protein
MQQAALFAYAYLVGSAFSALIGSAMEQRMGAEAGLRPPFVAPDRIVRSLGLTLSAGPYLLTAELRMAFAKGRISVPAAIAGLLFASFWALATGILLVELMGQVRSAL